MRNSWLVNEVSEDDNIRMICFPYAGGGASVYREWKNYFGDELGIYPVQLPGRENRIGENLFYKMEELVEALFEDLFYLLDKPFIFFGHSLGARIAFEFARIIRKNTDLSPECLLVAGSRAPEFPEPKPLHHLVDDEFVEELKRFSGTPDAVLENRELMEMFIPVLRADFTVIETCVYKEEEPFEFPIYSFGGTNDPEALYDEVLSWSNHTKGKFSIEMIKGGHFFINEQKEELLSLVAEKIEKYSAVRIT